MSGLSVERGLSRMATNRTRAPASRRTRISGLKAWSALIVILQRYLSSGTIYLLEEAREAGFVFQDQVIAAFEWNEACSWNACRQPPSHFKGHVRLVIRHEDCRR